MNTDDVKLLYDYNCWANRIILATCSTVSQEQYVAPVGDSSLRATVVHILRGEQRWRLGFQKYFVPADSPKVGAPAQEAPLWDAGGLTETDLPTLEALQGRWEIEEKAMRDYLASLSDQDLNGIIRYRATETIVRERVLWQCLVHVMNHGTQHRSEAAMMLTSYGQSPGALDMTAFMNEHFKLQAE